MGDTENVKKITVVNMVRFLDYDLFTSEEMDEETKTRINSAKENLDAAYELTYNDFETIAYVDITELVKKAEEVQNSCFDYRVAVDLSVMGKKAMLEKKYELAVFYFNKALRYNSQNPAFWCDRAEAHHNAGDLPKALNDCRQALSLKPVCARAYNRMGLLHCCTGDHTEGLECFKTAINMNESNLDYQINHRVVTDSLVADSEAQAQARSPLLTDKTSTRWSVLFESDVEEQAYDFCENAKPDDDISKLIIYRDGKDIDATRPLTLG